MLSKQPWIKYAPELRFELQQCLDEGRDVEKYREECERIISMDKGSFEKNMADLGVAGREVNTVSELKEKLAIELGNKMKAEPVSPDYPYVEPSQKDAIFAECASDGTPLKLDLTAEQINDRIAGAWIGRISGCMLGKPVEGIHKDQLEKFLKKHSLCPLSAYLTLEEAQNNYEQGDLPWSPELRRGWADTVSDGAEPDDDTDYTILALKLVREYGRDFLPMDVLENWLGSIPFLAVCTAERYAYKNACMGMLPPETATHLNPFREWIGGQIRADFYGYINPGDTRTAADMAFRDASISHVGNGIYGAMWVAAMHAAAFAITDIKEVVKAGLAEIPTKSRFHEDVSRIIALYENGATYREAFDEICKKYPHSLWVHTNPNAMIVAAALLYGEGDFSKTVCISVEGGYDTDCNGATAGSVIGAFVGKKNVPAVWTESYNGLVKNRVFGFNNPASIDDLTEMTVKLLK